nr:hypothetical protein [Mycoplasmopsis bovis]
MEKNKVEKKQKRLSWAPLETRIEKIVEMFFNNHKTMRENPTTKATSNRYHFQKTEKVGSNFG